MKTLRVFISASTGLEEAERGVHDLLVQLSQHFKPRGLEFVAALPGEGAAEGEMAVALYGKDFGGLPKERFEEAYEAFKAGKKPKIYVFFREPSEDISEALKAFRDSFAERYGHFYCHFETVDAVKFQLAVQSLSLLPGGKEDNALRVSDTEIVLGEERIASLENLPFAKLNTQRQSLLRQISAAEREMAHWETACRESPGNETVEETLRLARARRHGLKEELKHHDEYLLASAVFFAKESAGRMDERVRKAYELFERGKIQAANRILDLEELVKKDEIDKRLYDEARKARQAVLQGFLQKGETALEDDSRSPAERHAQAREALEHALRVAREIFCEEEEIDAIMEKLDAIPADEP